MLHHALTRAPAAAILAVLALAPGPAAGPASAQGVVADCLLVRIDPAPKREPLEIATAGGVVPFQVEVAQSDEQRSVGLMCRKELPERGGMLFDFKVDQPVFMWMKNTLIPLDMLFIRADGSIARIVARTKPLSTATVSSGQPVRAVLEIAGGEADRLGIKVGDKVAHPMFPAK